MTSSTAWVRGTVGAALLVLVAGLPASAESRAAEDVTPLALARRATVVAVVTRQADEPALRVSERLRGPVLPGQVLELATRSSAPATGGSFVVHLVPGPEGTVELLGGPLGSFPLPEGPAGDATATLFRTLAPLADADAADPPALRAALVAAVRTATPRARAGAAHDLWQEPGLLAGATPAERAAVLDAFRGATGAGRTHLARAVGRLRAPASGPLLVDALVGEGGESLAPAVGRALRDLADDDAVADLAGRSAGAPHAVRERIAHVLGEIGRASARPALEALLRDTDSAVRVSAAVGLGRLRSRDAANALVRRFRATETDAGVRRALVWALAQCNDDSAWDTLRTAAATDSDERLRRFAADTLRNPRRSFVR